MYDWQSLAHVRWECKYHVIIIPKFRRTLYGQLRRQVGRILRESCAQRSVELMEGKAMANHAHLWLNIPPKYSVVPTIGSLKGKSAVGINRNLLRKRCMTELHFWSTGYCVSTVGLKDGSASIFASTAVHFSRELATWTEYASSCRTARA